MEIYLDKKNKTIVVPFGILQKNHVDFIKNCGFSILETDILKNDDITIKKFKKNKNRKKNKKNNYKKK